MYSELYLQNKKTPSPILIGLAIFCLLFFTVVSLNSGSRPSKATSAKSGVTKSQIVNLSFQEAGLFWETQNKMNSWVVYGTDKNNLKEKAFEERDLENKKNIYKMHFVWLRNLEEGRFYYYRIVTSSGIFPDYRNDPLNFTTPKMINTRSNLKPAYGKIYAVNGLPAENVFVLLNPKNNFSLLTLTKKDGSFVLPLNYFVETGTHAIILPKEKDIIELELRSEDKRKTVITFIDQLNNLAPIILDDKDQNLTTNINVLSATKENSNIQNSTRSEMKEKTFSITFPREKMIIPAFRPLIKGKNLPGKEIFIHINSKPEYNYRTLTDSTGEWKILPTNSLIAGNYTLTAASTDSQGKQIEIKREFTIAKNGEQVLGEATDESTLSPTSTVVLTPTVVPTAENQFFTPTPAIPKTGANNNLLMIISASLIVVGFGFLLVF